MNLSDIRKAAPKRKKIFLAGRGRSSGLGKTCGVGGKGQWGRQGTSFRGYFEGGQMPLIRRLPKRGFNNNQFKTNYETLSLDVLDKAFANGDTVDEKALRDKGLVRRHDPIKITGMGKITKKLTVKVDRFTKTAADAIVKAGGTAEALNPAPPPKKKPETKPAGAPSKPEAKAAPKPEAKAKPEGGKPEKK